MIDQTVLSILVPSLRAMSLAAQVKAGMWRRNGAETMDTQVMNYDKIPLAVYLRDTDLRAVQCCAMLLDPCQVSFLSSADVLSC